MREPTSLEILEAADHLLVCRAIERDDAISDAVLEILAGSQREWTLDEWENLLATGLADRRKIRHFLADLGPSRTAA